MANGLTHEQYVLSVRRRVADTAAQLLNGSIAAIEGVRIVLSLLHEAELSRSDDDYLSFVGADSETDYFPIGRVRELWSEQALEKLAPEIASANSWVRCVTASACQSLILRFANEAVDDASEE